MLIKKQQEQQPFYRCIGNETSRRGKRTSRLLQKLLKVKDEIGMRKVLQVFRPSYSSFLRRATKISNCSRYFATVRRAILYPFSCKI